MRFAFVSDACMKQRRHPLRRQSAELQPPNVSAVPAVFCVRMKALSENFTSRFLPPGPVSGSPGVPPAWNDCSWLRHAGSSSRSLRGGFRCPSVCSRMASGFHRIPSTAGPRSPENTHGCRPQALDGSEKHRRSAPVSNRVFLWLPLTHTQDSCWFFFCRCEGSGREADFPPAGPGRPASIRGLCSAAHSRSNATAGRRGLSEMSQAAVHV